MSRKKFWAYLRNENGQPIPSASIFFKLNGTNELATIYSTPVSAANDAIDQNTMTTDVSGFFEFFVGDSYEEGSSVGYQPDQLFQIEWESVDGSKSGTIDNMQLFYQIFPVDATDPISNLKNKLASNNQTYLWETHRQQTWFHEVHDITALDWQANGSDGTFNKLVSNSQMDNLRNRLISLQASGADSITIEASGTIGRGFDIPSGSWLPASGADYYLYYYDVIHNFNSRYPITQVWCKLQSCLQYPAKIEYRDSNTARIFVPSSQRDGKHVITISDISPTITLQNPIFEANVFTLNKTLYGITTNLIVDVSASVGSLTLSTTPLSATMGMDVSPSTLLQTLTMTQPSATTSISSSGFESDYFTDGLGTQWTQVGSGIDDTTPGVVIIDSGEGTINTSSFDVNSGIYQEGIAGDFDIKCKISDHGTINDKISFGAYVDFSHYLIVYKDSVGNAGYVYKGSGSGTGTSGTFSSTTFYMRVKRTGSDMIVYRSDDGSNWFQITSNQNVGSGEARIYVVVSDNGNTPLYTATVDSVINFGDSF